MNINRFLILVISKNNLKKDKCLCLVCYVMKIKLSWRVTSWMGKAFNLESYVNLDWLCCWVRCTSKEMSNEWGQGVEKAAAPQVPYRILSEVTWRILQTFSLLYMMYLLWKKGHLVQLCWRLYQKLAVSALAHLTVCLPLKATCGMG